VRFLGSSLPRMREIMLDAGVLTFTFAVAVVTGIATGAAPAWRLSRAEPGDALKEGGRTDAASGGRRLHNALVVVEVALSLVLLEGGSNQPIAIEGRPELAMADQPEVSVRVVSPGFFQALRIPLRQGRDFTDADNATAPRVVIISESMAKRFWPGEDAIGKRL